MTATRKLYWDDPFARAFEAEVIAHGRYGDWASVVLAATALYPESGGQTADRGTLGGMAVLDVQIDDAGVIHHRVEGPPPAVGARLAGTVDGPRRRANMALHTGQHLLSAALVEAAGAATVSSRLGETACTIDLDRDDVPDALVARAEALANEIVDDDVLVEAFFPTPEVLAGLRLRRAPKVDAGIRVVRIGDFDLSPCGGTHCTRSAQIGLLRVTGTERYKGKRRVSFEAGPRARAALSGDAEVLAGLARALTCGPRDVPSAIERLRVELGAAREAAGLLRARVADAVAEAALADPERMRICECIDGADVETLRVVARRLEGRAGMLFMLGGRGGDALRVLLGRGPGATADCGTLARAIAQALGGKGGGRPDRAEVTLPAATPWEAVARYLPAP